MNKQNINVLIIGVSCFDRMASSMRMRNLIEPLIEKKLVTVSNLVYEKDNREALEKSGMKNNIGYRLIGFRLKNPFSIFSFLFAGFSFIKKCMVKNEKNIFYSYNYPDVKNILFIIYAKLIGYKVVFDIIEDNMYQVHVGFINKMRLKSSVLIFKFSRYFANAMVCISDHLLQLARTTTKNKVPTYLIPITVNLAYFNNIQAINGSNVKIFYGGSFHEKDGLDYLLEAFNIISKEHSNAELVFTGIGNKLDMDMIFAKIEKQQHKNRINYKGFLSTEEYYRTLNECDIFCMTRVNSKFANAGFPFKLGEFLASGKAVVATKVGDVPNYLFNDVNALVVEPNSATELASALSTLIENPDQRKRIGTEARKTAEKYFDSDKVGITLLEIFRAA
jgi:glycosyltransferase involved in cell wall biosynthesis